MASSSDVTIPLETKKTDVAQTFVETDTEKCNEDVTEPKVNGDVEESNKNNVNSNENKETSNDLQNEANPGLEKQVNGVKSIHSNAKLNVLGNTLPLNPETWTVTSDSQIWLECCQNSFRACGGNVRSFQPHSPKQNCNQPNHLYNPMQGTCPQGHRNTNAMNYNRNSQYVVHLHVNPGETISFDMGDHVQLIPGNYKTTKGVLHIQTIYIVHSMGIYVQSNKVID